MFIWFPYKTPVLDGDKILEKLHAIVSQVRRLVRQNSVLEFLPQPNRRAYAAKSGLAPFLPDSATLGRRQADPAILRMTLCNQTTVFIPGDRDVPDFDILLIAGFVALTSNALEIACELDLSVSAAAKPKA
jgi:hypothetical protein